MKVYVVIERWPNDYDDCIEEWVIGVYSTQAKAEAVKGVHHTRHIEEHELDKVDNL